jgi:hypothetical protein
MPLAKYFRGKGQEVMSDMQNRYGGEEGKRVFYATANSKPGMKPDASAEPSGQPSPRQRAAPPETNPKGKRKTIGQRMTERWS